MGAGWGASYSNSVVIFQNMALFVLGKIMFLRLKNIVSAHCREGEKATTFLRLAFSGQQAGSAHPPTLSYPKGLSSCGV